MAEFSVYCYQCRPIRCIENTPGFFPEVAKKEDERSLLNMKNHQDIIARMFTTDVEKLFMCQKKNEKGELENCLGFQVGGKIYPFKVLMPRRGESGNDVIMLRVAKLTKKNREHNFNRSSWIDEPSALVVVDNHHDQQRVLIENTSTWPDTDVLRNILIAAINEKLRAERLVLIMEPVWRKSDFWNTVRRYQGHIRTIEFELGYPNMGRTGNKFLTQLKDTLSSVYASGTLKMSFNREVRIALKQDVKEKIKKKELPEGTQPLTAMDLDPDKPDALVDEISTHVAEGGYRATLGLDNGTSIHMGRIPERVRKTMSEEQKKLYPDEPGLSYSTLRVSMSKRVSEFDGQDDLFNGTYTEVNEHLTDLKDINYNGTTGPQA